MSEYNILVIDDNFNAAESVRKYGEKTRGYTIKCAETLKSGVEQLKNERFDLVTLDIEMGNENGLYEMGKIKSIYGGPIIFVSCLSDAKTISSGFKKGADDYICKPFDLEELFLRIERSIRRSGNYRELEISDYQIDEYNNKVYYNGTELVLTDLAVKLLIFLLKNKNKVQSRKKIFEEVWSSDYSFSTRVIDTHISFIRKATKDKRIKSIRGKGYAFIDSNEF